LHPTASTWSSSPPWQPTRLRSSKAASAQSTRRVNLTATARVNGEEWSRGDTGDTSYPFQELIAYMSRSETLYPGDFIGSGTISGPQGKGCGLDLGRFLQPGNVVELDVEQIGVLRNRVIA
jgi:2-keto-4-pentenoate hydratase/2-oxohepta-3-ene-1,7-dioic acid hydratase in catechol pathway